MQPETHWPSATSSHVALQGALLRGPLHHLLLHRQTLRAGGRSRAVACKVVVYLPNPMQKNEEEDMRGSGTLLLLNTTSVALQNTLRSRLNTA